MSHWRVCCERSSVCVSPKRFQRLCYMIHILMYLKLSRISSATMKVITCHWKLRQNLKSINWENIETKACLWYDSSFGIRLVQRAKGESIRLFVFFELLLILYVKSVLGTISWISFFLHTSILVVISFRSVQRDALPDFVGQFVRQSIVSILPYNRIWPFPNALVTYYTIGHAQHLGWIRLRLSDPLPTTRINNI